MLRRFLAAAVAVGLALTAAGCGSSDETAGGAGTDKVTYLFGTAAPNLADSVWFAVGQEAGFFKEQGVDVKGLYNDGSSAAIKALAGGAGDVAVSELPNVIGAASTGVPVEVFSNFVHRSANFLGVLPDSPVKTVSDLAGKTVGVPSVGSGSELSAKTMLREAGVDVAKVKFVAVGAGGTVKDALTKGDVDAMCTLELHFKTLAARTGLKVRYLDRPAEFDKLTGALFVRKTGNSDDRNDAIDRFTRAAWQSILFTIANPDRAVEMAYKVYPDLKTSALPQDPEIATAFYSNVIPAGADWKTVTDWATLSEEAFDGSFAFAKDNDLLIGKTKVSFDTLVDTGSFATINDFDRAAVIEKAQK